MYQVKLNGLFCAFFIKRRYLAAFIVFRILDMTIERDYYTYLSRSKRDKISSLHIYIKLFVEYIKLLVEYMKLLVEYIKLLVETSSCFVEYIKLLC